VSIRPLLLLPALLLTQPMVAGAEKRKDTPGITDVTEANVTEAEVTETKPSVVESTTGIVDRTHSLVSESFNRFIYQIDDTIGGGEPVEYVPGSTAKLRFDLTKNGNDRSELKGTIKVRAVLPRSEKRLRLLISTEEDLKATDENTQDSGSNTDGLSFALRFIRQARDHGYVNFDLGARWRDNKVQMFGRINLAFDYRHGKSADNTAGRHKGFHSKFANSLYQYSSSGFENRLRYDLSRTLDERDSLVLRGSTDVLWRDDRHGALISETIGLYADIDEKRALALELLGSYTTRLNGEDTEHYRGTAVRFRFRHNFRRKWFFYEFWPGVTWNADNGYRMAFQSLIRVETVLGRF
jgi:hypothetical protein